MKTVTIDEAGKAVRQFAGRSGNSTLRVMSRGKLVAYILPANRYDEEDIGYMTDASFWKMIAERRKSTEFVSLEEIKKDLAERERREAMTEKRSPAKAVGKKWKAKSTSGTDTKRKST